jgi:hypothetical protein
MDNGSFYDEGLVAAARGVLLERNPYEVGTVHYREWREGFFSYGRARHAGRLELPVRDSNGKPIPTASSAARVPISPR